MIDLQEVITDYSVFAYGYILRNGFVFTSITEPTNVYDAIVIKYPADICGGPERIVGSKHTLEEQINFIKENKLEKAIIVADDISFITSCPSLKILEIIPPNTAKGNYDFSPLYSMPEIKELNCITTLLNNDLPAGYVDYSKINGLENLGISGKGHMNYEKVATLKTLNISGFKGTNRDVTDLFCSKNLEDLTLVECGIKTLEGIDTSAKLNSLSLWYNRSLCDVSEIAKISGSLKTLSIEACAKIKDFSFLSQLFNIEFLELNGSNSLPNLEFLKEMHNIKFLNLSMNVLDGDLSPCLNIPYVSVKNRKHYNLKDKDLPKNIPKRR